MKRIALPVPPPRLRGFGRSAVAAEMTGKNPTDPPTNSKVNSNHPLTPLPLSHSPRRRAPHLHICDAPRSLCLCLHKHKVSLLQRQAPVKQARALLQTKDEVLHVRTRRKHQRLVWPNTYTTELGKCDVREHVRRLVTGGRRRLHSRSTATPETSVILEEKLQVEARVERLVPFVTR